MVVRLAPATELKQRTTTLDDVYKTGFFNLYPGFGDCASDKKGKEVAQIYIRDKISSIVRPERELIGFMKLEVEAGESKKVEFHFSPSQFAFLDEDMKWKVEKGEYEILVGSSANDIYLNDTFIITENGYTTSSKREFFPESYICD